MRYLIGFGSYSMADDSIGLRIVDHIIDHGLDREFEAVGIADEGTRLLSYLTPETEKIVLIDAMDLGLPAGEHRLFEAKDVETTKETSGWTTHEGDVLKILGLAESLGHAIPPLTILGIQIGSLEPGMELSPALRERFDAYLRVAVEEIRKDL